MSSASTLGGMLAPPRSLASSATVALRPAIGAGFAFGGRPTFAVTCLEALEFLPDARRAARWFRVTAGRVLLVSRRQV